MHDIDREAFGLRVRARREELGLLQREIREAIGFKTDKSVSQIERGRSFPRGETLAKLARVLHTDPEWLMYGAETVPAEPQSHDLATTRAVDAFLQSCAVAAIIPPEIIESIRSMSFGDVRPDPKMIECIALRLLERHQQCVEETSSARIRVSG